MAKSVEIPQDIIDIIIAAVGDDTCLLKQCSLVSSSFLLPSRKQLFSRVTFSSNQNCQEIHQFLVQNPVIQSSIRAITLFEYGWDKRNTEWIHGASILAILRLPFRCLDCFSINASPDHRTPGPWNWNKFSSELKDALSNIIYSSNLKTLSLEGITNLPTTFFLPIVHLTTLRLISDSLNDYHYIHPNYATQAVSNGVVSVVDRCIWRLRKDSGYRPLSSRGTRFPSSAYFSLIQDIKVLLGRRSYHSCVVYAS